MLTIADYDTCETEATAALSMRAIQAFSPATFQELNYPTRVSNESSLIRYVDTMHETFEGRFFDAKKFRFTKTEGDLIGGVASTVADMTETQFGWRIRPWMAPFGAVPALRVILGFAKRVGLERPHVFELGPGSAYLGAMLLARGFRYGAMDNTQGFYIWQNRLMQAVSGDKFVEYADKETLPETIDDDAYHLAWWQFAQMGATPPINADIVVCDHALGELHPFGLKFVLWTIRRLLRGEGPKLFFFTSPGKEHNTDINGIGRMAQAAGLKLLLVGPFIGFTVPESSIADWGVDADHAFKTHLRYRFKKILKPVRFRLKGTPLADMRSSIPMFRDHEDEPYVTGPEIIPLHPEEEALDYEFLRLMGFRTPLEVAGPAPK